MKESDLAAVEVNGRRYAWPDRPLVVVCVDGNEPDYVAEAIRAGCMPFTEHMMRNKASFECSCVVPTFTNPNNLSIVTGVPPSIHGICGNYFYDRDAGAEVMMNDPALLRAPTILAAFRNAGARVAVVTAKDKLQRLLGHGLKTEPGEAVCISAEAAGRATAAENGIDDLPTRLGLPVPDVYSAKLSRFVFVAGVYLMETMRPHLTYLSTTDFIQHTHAPGSTAANAFYAMMDSYWARLDALGATVAVVADHGMNAKTRPDGTADVVYLQDILDERLGPRRSRVILPITDPYVAHHGALGSFATVYLADPNDMWATSQAIGEQEGIEHVLRNEEACGLYDLPSDRIGDLVVIGGRRTVVGTSVGRHDLSRLEAPLRSHGGLAERTVPMMLSRVFTRSEEYGPLRNFDVFDIALNNLS